MPILPEELIPRSYSDWQDAGFAKWYMYNNNKDVVPLGLRGDLSIQLSDVARKRMLRDQYLRSQMKAAEAGALNKTDLERLKQMLKETPLLRFAQNHGVGPLRQPQSYSRQSTADQGSIGANDLMNLLSSSFQQQP